MSRSSGSPSPYFGVNPSPAATARADVTAGHRGSGRDWKGLSALAYVIAIPLAVVSTWLSLAIDVGVAIVWPAPDRCISRVMAED